MRTKKSHRVLVDNKLVAEFGEKHLLAAGGRVKKPKGYETMLCGGSSCGRRPITRKGGKLTAVKGCYRQNIRRINISCIEAAFISR